MRKAVRGVLPRSFRGAVALSYVGHGSGPNLGHFRRANAGPVIRLRQVRLHKRRYLCWVGSNEIMLAALDHT